MKRILLSFFLTIFLISAAAVFTLNFRPLYYHDISSLGIEEISGYSERTIRENYDALIDYNSIFHRGSLNLTLPMSEEGRIHFEDVKKIFDSLQILCLISLVVSFFWGRYALKQKEWKFFRDASILSLLLPTIAGALIAANWDKAFVLFHEVMFSNDYWLFDERTDPVIKILPDGFFLHCALCIIILILLGSLCFALIYRFRRKRSRSPRIR